MYLSRHPFACLTVWMLFLAAAVPPVAANEPDPDNTETYYDRVTAITLEVSGSGEDGNGEHRMIARFSGWGQVLQLQFENGEMLADSYYAYQTRTSTGKVAAIHFESLVEAGAVDLRNQTSAQDMHAALTTFYGLRAANFMNACAEAVYKASNNDQNAPMTKFVATRAFVDGLFFMAMVDNVSRQDMLVFLNRWGTLDGFLETTGGTGGTGGDPNDSL